MKRSTIRIIIFLATALLIGLVTIQIFWVNKAYDLTAVQLDHDITAALKTVAFQIRDHNNDSAQIMDPVDQLSPNFYRVRINDTLHPYYLQTLLANEFRKQEINIDFEYSIYDCFTDSVVYSQTVQNEEDISESAEVSPDIAWDSDAHYFSVYFPTIGTQVLKGMDFWWYSSALLFIVACFFAYTISVILRQKRLSEVKTDFINNMTHELKTPISTISLSADVLMNPDIFKDTDRLQKYAQIIRNENNRLQNQVERVLQVASLDKEEIELRKKPIDINAITQSAVHTIEINVQEKSGKIKLDLDANSVIVAGDEVHLTNIIYNLLDNATKYSNGPPDITVSTHNKNGGMLIVVADKGIGMAKEHLKQIFDKFFRVPKGNVHDVKGFGLGLHYVKTIVEAHGGKVSVESKLNEGSRFEIFIPAK